MQRWYQTYRGTRRIVIAIPVLGIVLKCPRLRKQDIVNFFTDVWEMGREMYRHSDPKVRRTYRRFVADSGKRCWRYVVEGVVDNWSERRYYKHTNALYRLLLQPTHFSLLGMLNIQRLGFPADDVAVYHACYLIAGQDLVTDGHHWDTPSNFDVSSGGLLLLDYGSKATQRIIDKYGLGLLSQFNLAEGQALKEKWAKARGGS